MILQIDRHVGGLWFILIDRQVDSLYDLYK